MLTCMLLLDIFVRFNNNNKKKKKEQKNIRPGFRVPHKLLTVFQETFTTVLTECFLFPINNLACFVPPGILIV